VASEALIHLIARLCARQTAQVQHTDERGIDAVALLGLNAVDGNAVGDLQDHEAGVEQESLDDRASDGVDAGEGADDDAREGDGFADGGGE
jgi:hypothetical protein